MHNKNLFHTAKLHSDDSWTPGSYELIGTKSKMSQPQSEGEEAEKEEAEEEEQEEEEGKKRF